MRITSRIRLDRDDDTLYLEIKCRAIWPNPNRRMAATCAIKLPPEIKFVKVKGATFPLSELRPAESVSNNLEPEIVFKPRYFPFTGKIRCYNR